MTRLVDIVRTAVVYEGSLTSVARFAVGTDGSSSWARWRKGEAIAFRKQALSALNGVQMLLLTTSRTGVYSTWMPVGRENSYAG